MSTLVPHMCQPAQSPPNTERLVISRTRDPLFDVVKALMMLWVVWGHLSVWGVVERPIDPRPWMANAKIGVNMPLFFVIGGYLSLSTIQKGAWSKIAARVIGFLWIVAAFGVLFSIVNFTIGNAGFHHTLHFLLRWMKHGGHWFLRTFSAIYLLSAIIYRMARTDHGRWIGFCIGYCGLLFVPSMLQPLLLWVGGPQTIHMFPYFVFGLMVLRKREVWKSDHLSFLCGIVYLAIVFLEGNSTTNGMNFWKVSLFWRDLFLDGHGLLCFFARTAVGLTGSVFFLWLVNGLLRLGPRLAIIAPLGTTTLGVYVMHWWPMNLIGQSDLSFVPLPLWTHWPLAIAFFLACHYAIVGIKSVPPLRFLFFGNEQWLATAFNHLLIPWKPNRKGAYP